MENKEKKEWLKAISVLKKFYKKQQPLHGIPYSYNNGTDRICPLCSIAKKIKSVGVCEVCLWTRFEDRSCIENYFHRHSTDQRLERLSKWESLLKAGVYDGC